MKITSSVILIAGCALLGLCCCLILFLGGATYVISNISQVIPEITFSATVFQNEITPTPFEITRQAVDTIPTETINLLRQTTIPSSDLNELACRFQGLCNIPTTLEPPADPYGVGKKESFWVNNEDSHSYFQVNATLRYITPHAYFWVENDTYYDQADVQELMDAFESNIYPTDRDFFGSEWTPGVDGDPHIYILYTSGLGSTVAGYYFSPDEYNPIVRKYSNAHEMFYMDSSESLSAEFTYGTLAHEFQHMIHWYQDANEMTFLNEGFSDLAIFLNDYPTGSIDYYYLSDPDMNLTEWLDASAGENRAHYGASFLFVTYFLDRFGEDITKALVHHQQNGLDSIDSVLTQRNITDPLTGSVVSADDFFLDWTIANYVKDARLNDGRYVYHNYPTALQATDTESIATCPLNGVTRTVNQYGVDYIRITCPGDYTLHFAGATTTRLLPAAPFSGSYAYWSNKGDDSDMTLTHEFDFRKVSGPIVMEYWTWYDIEQDYDYLYVETSTDGQEWTILRTPSGTAIDPFGASYGWGYSGQSYGWIQEAVDLSSYAGQNLFVRFEYITDPGVNGEGLLLDDVSIPVINYSTDFEADDNSWEAAGFIRIENTIPQTFRLALVTHTQSGTNVQILQTKSDQSIDIPISIGQNGIQDVVLVVTATARFTRQLAPYQFEIR